MLFEENISVITEEEFNCELEGVKDKAYLYHFIIVKYKEKYDIKTLKLDQVEDLEELKSKEIITKYYLKKIHYYNSCDNENFALGEPHHIYNLGFFYIGGILNSSKDNLILIKELLKEYEDNYKNMKFPFTDEEFLSLNKSVINF